MSFRDYPWKIYFVVPQKEFIQKDFFQKSYGISTAILVLWQYEAFLSINAKYACHVFPSFANAWVDAFAFEYQLGESIYFVLLFQEKLSVGDSIHIIYSTPHPSVIRVCILLKGPCYYMYSMCSVGSLFILSVRRK